MSDFLDRDILRDMADGKSIVTAEWRGQFSQEMATEVLRLWDLLESSDSGIIYSGHKVLILGASKEVIQQFRGKVARRG